MAQAREELTDELMQALGDDGFFALTEAYGGTRLYVPGNPDRSELPAAIGHDNAIRLSNLFPGGYIRVPLAREFRAARYRDGGASNRDIARRLGITEGGVDRLFQRRLSRQPELKKSKKDPRQTELF